jgi:hypothetical protein
MGARRGGKGVEMVGVAPIKDLTMFLQIVVMRLISNDVPLDFWVFA